MRNRVNVVVFFALLQTQKPCLECEVIAFMLPFDSFYTVKR